MIALSAAVNQQAVAFQWVNPKAWSMALGAIAAYVPAQGYAANLVLAALVFTLVNLPCVASWAGFGLALRGLLADRRRLRLFNWAMGALLAASLVPVLLEAL